MKILKILMSLLLTGVLIIIGLYFYYIYTPKPSLPNLSGKYQQHNIISNGIERKFNSYIPANIPENSPLVFILHGSTRSGEKMRQSSAFEFDELADTRNFIAVYPDGYLNHWNDCRASADYQANTENINDTLFFKDMIEFFKNKYQVNQQKVYATGISNGGHMAFKLALEAPEIITAIAPIAANLPVQENSDCQQSNQAVPVALFNGTHDPINPYQGGMVTLAGNASRGKVLSTDETMAYWLNLANITQPAEIKTHNELDNNKDTSVIQSTWKANNALKFQLYTLQGSGHVFPSTKIRAPRILGASAGDISSAKEIINFFLD